MLPDRVADPSIVAMRVHEGIARTSASTLAWIHRFATATGRTGSSTTILKV
jgi:hypothetical protein